MSENREQDNQTPVVMEAREIRPVEMGMLQAETPAAMMEAARKIAEPLKEFINERRLLVFLQGAERPPHVYVEGWTTMLAMLSVMAQEIKVEEVYFNEHYPECRGWGPKYVATMALVRVSDQKIICSASAECGGPDERDWHWRPKYKWITNERGRREKVPDGEAPVAGSQRRSMAITRATGKAARIGFSWIMQMAGYSPTPAEEFGRDDRERVYDPQPENAHPEKGRDPREMMGDRGRKNQAKQDGNVKRMKAKFPSPCELCRDEIQAGDEIAFMKDDGGSHVAHWKCYEERGK